MGGCSLVWQVMSHGFFSLVSHGELFTCVANPVTLEVSFIYYSAVLAVALS